MSRMCINEKNSQEAHCNSGEAGEINKVGGRICQEEN